MINTYVDEIMNIIYIPLFFFFFTDQYGSSQI